MRHPNLILKFFFIVLKPVNVKMFTLTECYAHCREVSSQLKYGSNTQDAYIYH